MRTRNYKVVIRAFNEEKIFLYSKLKDADSAFYTSLRWILDKQLHAYYLALCVGDYIIKYYEHISIQRKILILQKYE